MEGTKIAIFKGNCFANCDRTLSICGNKERILLKKQTGGQPKIKKINTKTPFAEILAANVFCNAPYSNKIQINDVLLAYLSFY